MAFYDYDLTEQVKGKHELSKIEEVVGFSGLVYRFKDLANSVGRQGYGVEVGIKALYLQFHYDLSDRELEERLRFDIAFKWFCGFTAFGETPDHRFFGRFRKAMGTKRIGVLFKAINRRAEENGLLKKTFRFADATSRPNKRLGRSVTKRWQTGKRHSLIKTGLVQLIIEARFGCKGKSKFWFGYKGHVSVDMGSMLIDRIAATPQRQPIFQTKQALRRSARGPGKGSLRTKRIVSSLHKRP